MGSASSDAISRISDWSTPARLAAAGPARKPTDEFGSLTFN